jgi:hypothetical protein
MIRKVTKRVILLITAIIGLVTAIIYLNIASVRNQREKPAEPVHSPSTSIIIGGDLNIDNSEDHSTTNITQTIFAGQGEPPAAAATVAPIPEPSIPQNPPKTAPIVEPLKIFITETSGGSGSVFNGDVYIELKNILSFPDYAANGTVTVKSTGEREELNNMAASSSPLRMGDYQINIVELARDYAVFHITKGER